MHVSLQLLVPVSFEDSNHGIPSGRDNTIIGSQRIVIMEGIRARDKRTTIIGSQRIVIMVSRSLGITQLLVPSKDTGSNHGCAEHNNYWASPNHGIP